MVALRGVLVPTLRGILGGVFPRLDSGVFNPLTDYDWYVDSSVGSSGDGTTAATAFKTPEEAATACASGDTIAFKRGTTARGLFNAGAKDNLTLLAYGEGALPIVTAYDVHSGAWTQHGTLTNVWFTSVTPEVDATPNRRIVARKNGTPMELRTTQAAVDTSPPVNDNPGGYYAPDLDGSTGTYAVSIYASADPGGDGQTYEMSVRNNAVSVGNNCTVQNLRLVGGMGKDGPLSTLVNALVEDCVIEDGRWHNAVLSSGVVRRCDFIHMENSALSANSMLTFFKGTVTSETYKVEDCLFMLKFNPADGYSRQNGKPGYNHTSDASRYATGEYTRCKALWMCDGFDFSGSLSTVANHCVVARLAKTSGTPDCCALQDRQGTVTINNCRFYGNETGHKATPSTVSHVPSGNGAITFNHCLFDGNSAGGYAVQVNQGVTFNRCLIHFPSFHMIRDNNLSAAQVTLSGTILDGGTQRVMRLDHASSSLAAADNDQVKDSTLDWTVGGGTTYADFAAVQTAGFEASGVVSNPSYSTSYAGAVEPIATWTASGARGPDTTTWTNESIDAATILAAVLAK